MQKHWPILAALVCLLAICAPSGRAFDEDHKENINGTMLHFRVRGADKANPYLLILHGGPGFSAHMFYPWGPSLEKAVNVVYLDQRGCGESAHLPVANPQDVQPAEVKGYTVATLLTDIEGVRQSLHISRWFVLGHSWGGMLGLEYVAAHPEHVAGFIDMDALVSVPAMEAAMLDGAQAKFQSAKSTAAGGAMLTEVDRLRALPQTDPMRLFGTFGLAMGPASLYFAQDQATAFPAFNMKIAAAVKPYNVPFASLMPTEAPTVGLMINDYFLKRDDTPLLSTITVPTLIINGKQDGVITPQEAQVTHAGIKNSQLVLLDDCGHFPFVEQPEKTTASILSFLSKTQGRTVKAATADTSQASVDSVPALQLPRTMMPSAVKGPCIVRFVIDETGHPVQVIIAKSSGSEDFDAACVRAITLANCRAAYMNGKAHVQRAQYTFAVSQ